MKPQKLIATVAMAAVHTMSFAGSSATSYVTDVRLADGKALQCAVNEDSSGPGVHASALSASEQNEAEVLATYRLRLLSGPEAPYPSVYTAPSVVCVPANG